MICKEGSDRMDHWAAGAEIQEDGGGEQAAEAASLHTAESGDPAAGAGASVVTRESTRCGRGSGKGEGKGDGKRTRAG